MVARGLIGTWCLERVASGCYCPVSSLIRSSWYSSVHRGRVALGLGCTTCACVALAFSASPCTCRRSLLADPVREPRGSAWRAYVISRFEIENVRPICRIVIAHQFVYAVRFSQSWTKSRGSMDKESLAHGLALSSPIAPKQTHVYHQIEQRELTSRYLTI
jgi:hypothetical protein